MEIERAIEILDPEHREQYDSLATVQEACRMGMEALKKQRPVPFVRKGKKDHDLLEYFLCGKCGMMLGGKSEGWCSYCGQKVKWDG